MPPLEHMDLTDIALYWPMLKHNRHGEPVVGSHTQLCVRWEETNKEMLDANGERITIDVLMAASCNLVLNSMMWEGSLADLRDEVGSTLIPTSNLYEVITRVRAKDIKGCVTRYEFGLKRYKDTMPKIVDD